MLRALIIAVLLSGCSAQWHHKKACQKDAAYCGNYFQIDTFVVRDTFTYHFVDTTKMVDTITIDTGSIQVRIIRDRDIIRTTIKQNPDTAYLTITKTLPQKTIEVYPWWLWLFLLPVFMLMRK